LIKESLIFKKPFLIFEFFARKGKYIKYTNFRRKRYLTFAKTRNGKLSRIHLIIIETEKMMALLKYFAFY